MGQKIVFRQSRTEEKCIFFEHHYFSNKILHNIPQQVNRKKIATDTHLLAHFAPIAELCSSHLPAPLAHSLPPASLWRKSRNIRYPPISWHEDVEGGGMRNKGIHYDGREMQSGIRDRKSVFNPLRIESRYHSGWGSEKFIVKTGPSAF